MSESGAACPPPGDGFSGSVRDHRLTETDFENLERCYITREIAIAAGIRRVSHLDAVDIVGKRNFDLSGIVFPYYWPGEAHSVLDRLRLDNPPVEMKNGKFEPVHRYLVAPGSPNHLYLFRECDPALLADINVPVVITEGEKKVLALHRLSTEGLGDAAEHPRFLVVGLSGVWNWRGKIGIVDTANGGHAPEMGVIPDMSRITWKNCRVTILFDNNAQTNPQVSAARQALAQHLASCGARVYIAELPSENGINGIDDYLAKNGLKAGLAIIDQAKAYKAPRPPESQAVTLIKIATGLGEFFHAPDKTGYTRVYLDAHEENLKIDSTLYRQLLCQRLYQETNKAARRESMAEALRVIEAKAQFESPCIDVYLRLAPSNGGIIIDLGNDRWNAVEVTANGWRVIGTPAVRFRRSKGMLALPYPEYGGSIDELWSLVNLPENKESERKLFLGYLIGSYNPTGSYAVCKIGGEHGTAKSTTTRIMRALTDPNQLSARRPPRDERDLAIAAKHNRVISFDNVSSLPDWLSDALCAVATGGSFATRKLWENDEEQQFTFRQPILLNGISAIIERGDLADRTIVIDLDPIDKSKRRREADIWRDFERMRGRVFGKVLDAVSTALRDQQTLEAMEWPRMADFASFAAAGISEFGWTPEEFLGAYRCNRESATKHILETDVVAVAIQKLIWSKDWEGLLHQLLSELTNIIGEQTAKKKEEWPQTARGLGPRIRRLKPALREVGIEIHSHELSDGFMYTISKQRP